MYKHFTPKNPKELVQELSERGLKLEDLTVLPSGGKPWCFYAEAKDKRAELIAKAEAAKKAEAEKLAKDEAAKAEAAKPQAGGSK